MADDIPAILERLVGAGASSKQLGAVAAALGRAQWPPNILKRTHALRDALGVQESLERAGVSHHHLSSAVATARQVGLLSDSEGRAARRIVRRANAARHDRFYPERPPGVFVSSESEEDVSSIAGLDVVDWYSSDLHSFCLPGDADAGAGLVGAGIHGLHPSPLVGEPMAPPPMPATQKQPRDGVPLAPGEPMAPTEDVSTRMYTEHQVASALDAVRCHMCRPEAFPIHPALGDSPYHAPTVAMECIHHLRASPAKSVCVKSSPNRCGMEQDPPSSLVLSQRWQLRRLRFQRPSKQCYVCWMNSRGRLGWMWCALTWQMTIWG